MNLIRAAKIFIRRFSGYESAGFGRWPRASTITAPLSQALNARKTVSERAHFLSENSPYVRAITSNMITSFCGDGPSLQHPNAQIVEAWNRWWTSCDLEGVSDLGHMIARAMRSVIVTGDSFILLRVNEFSGSLELLLIPSDQVDFTRNLDLGNGWFITSGIETNSDGRHVAIWVLPRPPDHPMAGATSMDARRIPIDDVIHVYDPPTPGAVRGISWLVAALTRALEVDTLEDAQVAQQKVAALLSVFITDPSGVVNLGEQSEGEKDTVSLEPGAVRMINGDATATAINPPQNDNGVPFSQHMVRSLAAAAQVPYELVSADLSQTSFSSARFGDRFFRRRTAQVQKTILEPQLLNRVFRRFVALEVLSGRINVDLETLAQPKWLWPEFAPLDPLKDTDADVSAVAAGFASRAEIIAKRGRDISAVDAEIAADPRPAPQPTPKPQAQEPANAGDQNVSQ